MKNILYCLILISGIILFSINYAFCQAVELPSLDVGIDPKELKKYDPDYDKNQGEPIQESKSEEKNRKDNKNDTSRYRELLNEKDKEIPQRVKASPKYTVPNIDKKGHYGEAK